MITINSEHNANHTNQPDNYNQWQHVICYDIWRLCTKQSKYIIYIYLSYGNCHHNAMTGIPTRWTSKSVVDTHTHTPYFSQVVIIFSLDQQPLTILEKHGEHVESTTLWLVGKGRHIAASAHLHWRSTMPPSTTTPRNSIVGTAPLLAAACILSVAVGQIGNLHYTTNINQPNIRHIGQPKAIVGKDMHAIVLPTSTN